MDCCRTCTPCVLLLIIVFWSCGHVCCTKHQYGDMFIVALPYGADPDPGVTARSELRIVLTNPGADVTVMLKQGRQAPASVTIPAKSFTEKPFTPSSNYMLPKSGVVPGLTISLTSSGDFGVLVQGTSAYDGYLALPVSQWGKAYRVITHCQGTNATCQLVILASQDNTNVTVDIPSESNTFSVDDDNRHYAGPVTLNKVLRQSEAWVIAKGYEMTGALVTSNLEIGVLAGAQWTNYSGSEGAVLEQLPPLTALGQEYVTLGGGTVRVVSTEPNTTIHTTDTSSVLLKTAGQWLQHFKQNPVHLRANRPVLVAQFQKLQSTSSSPTWFPVFTVLTPVVQFLKPPARVIVPPYDLVAVTRQKYKGDVKIGANTLANANTSPSTAAIRSDYYVDVLKVSSSAKELTVTGSSEEVVGLYIQRAQTATASLSPLAALYDNVNPKDCNGNTLHKAGDTIDNDCDGLIDEDNCMAPGSTGIDCGIPNEGTRSTWGRKFVLVIPEYYNSSEFSLVLALTTLVKSGPVATSVALPDGTWMNQSLQTSSDTTSVTLMATTNTVLLTRDHSSNVIRISSDNAIGVTFYISYTTAGQPRGGAMRLIPERAFGREYYVVTICGNRACNFQVASVYDNTSIAIHLRLGDSPTASATFKGRNYTNGDVIRIDVSGYEALHVQCPQGCDLTGTLVLASKPVAVFSLSDFENLKNWYKYSGSQDVFLEQLPPVETYGRKYIALQQPDRLNRSDNYCSDDPSVCNDVIWIVSSEVQTTVELFNGSKRSTHMMDRAGGILVVLMDGPVVQIMSDRPVLVVQILKTLTYSSGALLVVPALSQYVQADTIGFGLTDIERQVVVYVADTPLQNVTVDGKQYSIDSQVTGPLFNVSYLLLNYTGAANQTEIRMVTGGKFGGYVSELGKEEKIFPLAYTLDPTNVACIPTKAVRVDGIDNDCDGNTDEESCPEGSEADNDGDGRFNEDCDKLPEVITTAPPDSTPEETTPEQTTPEQTTPQQTTPEQTTPEQTIPEQTTPKDTTPEDTTPEGTTPDDTTPENPTPSSISSTPALPTSSSTSITTQPSFPHSLCSCNCHRASATTSLSPDSLTSVLNSIVRELSVDKQELSSVRRKKISVKDDRPSAQTVGYFGVAIIIATAVGIVILDSGALYRDAKKLVASCKNS